MSRTEMPPTDVTTDLGNGFRVGAFVVVEGVDGAGKRTVCDALAEHWRGEGRSVATVAFPRYGVSGPADLGAEALRGQHGDLAASVEGMAVLWALDRADASAHVVDLLLRHEIVLADRYVASNAAYTAARHGEGADGPSVEWVRRLEFERFGLQPPDVQILLDVPVALAAERAERRERLDDTRERDAYERDADLQERTARVYAELAAQHWVSPWIVAGPDTEGGQLAVAVTNHLVAH